MEILKKKLGPVANLEFDKLFMGQLFSHFADAFVQFVLASILFSIGNSSGKPVAIMFSIFLIPQFLFSPLAGALCDRVSRKAVLFISLLFRALLIVLLLFVLPKISVNLIYLFAFLLGIGAAFFYTAKKSIITNIVKRSQFKFANAITSPVGAAALLFGILGAHFLMDFGYTTAFVTICSMYLAAAVLTGLIKLQYKQDIYVKKENTNSLKLTYEYLQRHKRALYLVILGICIQFIVAIFSNTLNALITDYYNLNFAVLTYLRLLLGIGLVVGMGAAIYFARIMRIPHLFAGSFIILCAALITTPLCMSINAAWAWLLPIGAADAVLVIMLDTIMQKVTPDRFRGKVFGFELTFTTLSFLLGTLVISVFAEHFNPLEVFGVIGIIAFALALAVLIFDKSFRYFLLKSSLGGLFLLLFRYKVEGAENIPYKGKVILAGNHTGHLDPFIIQMATSRQLWFVTGPGAFQVPIVRHLLKYFNVLPLKFGRGLEALESANHKLSAGEAVIIFPEGKFTPDGNLCKFNRGVGIMAKETGAPIVPFAIKGGFESWGSTRRLPKLFNTIVIQFGQPILQHEKDEKEIAHELQKRVNFMKKSLERRAFYNIKGKLHTNFLELMQEKGDIYGQVKALNLKTKDG